MKLTSRFKSDLKAVQQLQKYVGNTKLYNYSEPTLGNNFSITNPNYGNETKSIKDFLKNLTGILNNVNLKKSNPTTTFNKITIGVNRYDANRDSTIDVSQYSKPLSDVVSYLNKNKSNSQLVDNFVKHITGFNVDWEDTDKREKWYKGVASSIANQEKNNPNWSRD